jgi:polysaccharide deacetylase family protein (PEP-CTERM system associated)
MANQDAHVFDKRKPGALLNSITVDVEDYFHTEAMSSAVPRVEWRQQTTRVEKNTQRMFDLFAARGVRGTFFFLGWVAEKFPGLVREAAKLGHELGCHSYWHRLVYRLTPDEFREDTKRAKQVIEDAAGLRVLGYRAPSFSLVTGTAWALEILAELGFTYDSSVHPIRHDTYDNPEAPRHPSRIAGGALMEFPIATVAIAGHNFSVGGGAYLRILPYRYISWGLSRIASEKRSAVMYTHPWEIDPEQPRLRASARSRLRQYTGLRATADKLEKLMSDFRFAPIREVFSKELAGISSPELSPSELQTVISS